MIYYNQNNYGNIPYPSEENPGATIKSGGCGVCCGAMIISNLTAQQVNPVAMAQYAMQHGARVNGGTDMTVLADNICRDYDLTYQTTTNEAELLAHLQSGGWAVANVGGNRTGYTGVFSNGGHYIVVAVSKGNTLTVLDPGYYAGKFGLYGRQGKVTVDGDCCYCDISVLAADTANRSPAYWLFRKKVEEVPEWMAKIMADAKAVGLITSDHNPTEPATKWFVLAICLNLLKIIRGGN